ncbi:sugar phosphate isomerase/epimerase [Candidatus Woesearchaeota archaeon]|nr:sugar phosphate isomerase/epimerase [Candidatus Woesearchaeota archaeon]
MKLAISNIAWEQHDDPDILELLRTNGVTGIEVAPTKLWQDWKGASHKEAKEYKKVMQEQGFELPAIQAILFGRPELQLFDKSSHVAFLEHIKLVADLANGFGSKVMVFGAPKNRKRGQMPYSEAMEVAAEFFYKAGDICIEHECCIGLEHNPVEYGCDFATNVLDVKELVQKVNNQSFKLHVDSAGLYMCGGEIDEMIHNVGEFVHYHISEPMLEPIFDGVVDQKSGIETLRTIDYKEWVSIEMKQFTSVELLKKSFQDVKEIIFVK